MSESTTTIPRTYVGDGTTISVTGNTISALDQSQLGEIKMFALSITGAVTKANLNAKGWAICDGTDTATQVTTPTITGNTPDLRSKFLRGSANETTGGTGGSETHSHTTATTPYSFNTSGSGIAYFRDGTTGNDVGKITNASLTGGATSTLPPYYDICYFMKVK